MAREEIAIRAFVKATGRPLARPTGRAGVASARSGAIFPTPSCLGARLASADLVDLEDVLVGEDVVGELRTAGAELMEFT